MAVLGFFEELRTSKHSRFQAALVALLLASLVASLASAVFFIAVFVAFELACAILALGLPEADRSGAFAMLVFFSAVSLWSGLFKQFFSAPVMLAFAIPLLAAAFAAFFAIYKVFFLKAFADVDVIGFTNGFAVVKVKGGFSHDLKPGVYAVASGKVREGKARLKLCKNLFSASSISGVEQQSQGAGKKIALSPRGRK